MPLFLIGVGTYDAFADTGRIFESTGTATVEKSDGGYYCSFVLSTRPLGPIARDERARATRSEYQAAGLLAAPGDLKHLPEGDYVYLVTHRGEVLYSKVLPKLTREAGAPLIVSHRSLLAMAPKLTGRTPGVMAAGEFRVVALPGKPGPVPGMPGHWIIQEVNNRSRTFPGGPERLPIAEYALMQFGAPIVHGITFFEDYSNPGFHEDRHVEVEMKAKYALQAKDDPDYPALLEFAQEQRERFPHPKKVGALDGHAFMMALDQGCDLRGAEPGSLQDRMTWLMMEAFTHVEARGEPYVFVSIRERGMSVKDVLAETRYVLGLKGQLTPTP